MGFGNSLVNEQPHNIVDGAQPLLVLNSQSKDRLSSWKEISVFLNRGVRTVQRWEREGNLPVRRLNHGKRGTVFAYASEIERWMNNCDRRDTFASLDYKQLGQKCELARLRAENARRHIEVTSGRLTEQIDRMIVAAKRGIFGNRVADYGEAPGQPSSPPTVQPTNRPAHQQSSPPTDIQRSSTTTLSSQL